MPSKPNPELSLAELERILNQRRAELDDLLRRRDSLQQELKKVESEIHDIQGAKPPTQVPTAPSASGKRSRNPVSLRNTVVELLTQHPQGYTLAELADKIRETGYQSSSTNFRNVLYQCVYNTTNIFHDPSTGTYRLKKKDGPKSG